MKKKIIGFIIGVLFLIPTITIVNANLDERHNRSTSCTLLRIFDTLPFSDNNQKSDHKILRESVVLSSPILKESGDYMLVDLAEATSQISDIGAPTLPIVTRSFLLPFGSVIHDVKVCFSDSCKLSLTKKIAPTSRPVVIDSIAENKDIVEDQDIYESAMMYPSMNFSYMMGSGLQGNDHMLFCVVRCFPMQYSPLQQMIMYSKQIDIEIAYSQPDDSILFPTVYDMIIVTPEQFSSQLQSFVDHKNSHGLNTTIKTIESISSEYTGYDIQEKIKFFVKDSIESWGVSYVLLIGDVDKMPIRLSAVVWKQDGEVICSDIPTDLYYADMYDENASFCSWDSNGNGIYGEFLWEGNVMYMNDSVDLFADVNIGRIPCSSKKELQIVLDKIITYETQTAGQEWFTRLLFLAGDTYPDFGVNEGETIITKNAETMKTNGFEPIQLRTSLKTFRPLLINREWTKGAGFIGYSGHGYIKGFGTSPPNSTKRINYYNFYLLGIFNRDKLPIVFFDACSTSTIDYRQIGRISPCIAWSTLKKINGGSIATIGATRKAWLGLYNDEFFGIGYLDLGFFRAYTPGTTPSAMLVSAQNDYIVTRWKDCVSIEEMMLLGDPSLKIGGYS